jgi:CheY-like chemotaxis protein
MAAATRRRTLRIVVADNDPDALELAVTDLSLEGHEIVGVAAGGDEAVELCRRHQPDALVVDYRMPPGPNGLEVAQRVLGELPATRVVVYSNYASARLAAATRRAGADFLAKGNLRALRRALTA